MTGNNTYGDYSMMKPQNHNPVGRFPANLIHDGSEEVKTLFPQTKSTKGKQRKAIVSNKISLLNSKEVQVNCEYTDSGSAARFFYCAKASRAERTNNKTVENNHPTVKPIKLMRYLVRLVTQPGGIILDPFMGSGSTGKAAKLEGFDFIGIELDKEYFKIAQNRINSINND
ncbi:MAG TPA: site-specific DNA-methyltransferase [Candidatus Dependentiae bacterium]|nr:site-specific DNA-methyltransferase [Candidatus Dependentiae bacterium]